MTGIVGYSTETAWFANVFTATSSTPIVAVSFYTSAMNSEYSLNLYTWNTAETGPIPTDVPAFFASPVSGVLPLPGYHTVALPNAVPLTVDSKFSVVVQLTTPGSNFPIIPMEYPIAGYSSAATANTGQSFISPDGAAWTDLTVAVLEVDTSEANVCLKSFAGATISVSLNTPLSGFPIIVDSVPFSMPQTLNWAAGSIHTVNVASPQNDIGGTPFIFTSWSDGGARSHQVTAPAGPLTLTAEFLPCTQRPAKNMRSGLLYPFTTVQEAYDAPETINDDTLLLYALTPAQSLDLGRDISFALSGGYSCGFGALAADPYTALQGLTVSSGTVIVNNIVIL
jgi:hypothetical protein